jgi:drug/metabolite transporter (DMT)-like permease
MMTETLICLGAAFLLGVAGSLTSRRAERISSKPLLIVSLVFAVLCALAIIAAVIFLILNKG